MMRDPKRIERMLEILKEIWSTNPDLRLGQIIVNATHRHEDGNYDVSLFHMEDDNMEEALLDFLEKCRD